MPVTLNEVFAGRYKIVNKLGEGGMGAVFLAEDTRMHRRIALKVPQFAAGENTANVDRFYREARVAAELRHPGLCPVYDVDCWEGTHYLTMAFIEGVPLADYVRSGQPWPPDHAAALLMHLASALKVLHDRGIVHRDLKPGNIIVQPDGIPVLLDYGLARSVVAKSQQLTATGASVGTPAYMAPEQIGGQAAEIGPWTDVYSLGVILFQLLTGRLPFEAASVTELFGRVLYAERPLPSSLKPGLPAHLDRLCQQAMAIKRGDRPQGMSEFLSTLAGVQPVSPPPSPVSLPPTLDHPTHNPVPSAQSDTQPVPQAVRCPTCGKRIKVPATLKGKRIVCPGCRTRLSQSAAAPPTVDDLVEVVDIAEAEVPLPETIATTRPQQRPPAGSRTAPESKRRRRRDDEEDASRRKGISWPVIGLIVFLVLAGVWCFIGLIVMMVSGGSTYTTRSSSYPSTYKYTAPPPAPWDVKDAPKPPMPSPE